VRAIHIFGNELNVFIHYWENPGQYPLDE